MTALLESQKNPREDATDQADRERKAEQCDTAEDDTASNGEHGSTSSELLDDALNQMFTQSYGVHSV